MTVQNRCIFSKVPLHLSKSFLHLHTVGRRKQQHVHLLHFMVSLGWDVKESGLGGDDVVAITTSKIKITSNSSVK